MEIKKSINEQKSVRNQMEIPISRDFFKSPVILKSRTYIRKTGCVQFVHRIQYMLSFPQALLRNPAGLSRLEALHVLTNQITAFVLAIF